MRWNRIRRPWALLASFLFAVAGVGLLNAGSSRSVAEVLRDPLAVLSDRSPGGRGPGALFDTKPVESAALARARGGPAGAVKPTERVLPVTRERQPAFVTPPADWIETPLALAPGAEGTIPDDSPALASLPIGSSAPFGRSSPPACCGIATPGEEAGTGPAPDPDREMPAVPEPATWAMLIMGFFVAGSALRHQVRREAVLNGGSITPRRG